MCCITSTDHDKTGKNYFSASFSIIIHSTVSLSLQVGNVNFLGMLNNSMELCEFENGQYTFSRILDANDIACLPNAISVANLETEVGNEEALTRISDVIISFPSSLSMICLTSVWRLQSRLLLCYCLSGITVD